MKSSLNAATAALLLSAAATYAQVPLNNAERVNGGAYDRSHDYDLVHQRIELSEFNWDSTSFRGSVATTLVARRAALDSIILDAGKLLRIKSIMAAAGGTLRFNTHGDSLVVYPARAAAFGDTLRFTIVYDGKVNNGRGLTFIKPDGRPHRPQQIWSQGEDMNNHFWFPTYDFPNDKTTWEISATVPAGYTVVANGKLVSDRTNSDGTRTMDWSETHANATYLASLIVAPLAKLHDEWKGVPVDYYVYQGEDSVRAWPLFHVTPDMIDVYSRLTGIPYPWEKYAQTTVADFFGGMENVSATTLVDWLPDQRAYQDRPWYQWILIPHELAHQWFGDYVTTHDWSNTWLNEGFAEFMPGQYWAEKGGKHLEQDYYLDEYRQFMSIDARRRMPIAAEGSNNIYPKGALVLEMLRDYLGPQRFWAGIHQYLIEHAEGTANTDDLRQAIVHATGEDLDWFFNQWLYSAGYPEFDVAANYDAANHRLTLTVKQTQQDTSKADTSGLRFITPTVFRMPVSVQVGTATGSVTRQFMLDQRAQTLTIDSVAPPTMIAFDANNGILKKLTFNQPTAMLAEIVRRNDNLWNRQWAISQLAQRKDDPAALKALASAAATSDYYLTRVGAASALADFGATAVPGLQVLLRDTSAQVRSAALTALGQIGGTRAVNLIKPLYRNDPSYTVRAAALGALARADSVNRRTYIREGLATPSYRDAIQNTAVGAIVQSRDTAFIADIEKLMPNSMTPAFALGAMVRNGSTRALDVLVAHLNDPNQSVRRSALLALRQLPVNTIKDRLQNALPSLQFPDIRQAVEQLVKQ